ncbi:MAG: hypothetical protein HKO57_09885, partial [Akkermansiaceae bacterium]|nr:hypothetical protein [Akkermansiaceae bacterium]
MPSRRQIREGVIQYLYAEGPDGIPARAEDAASLALLLEPLRQKVVLARARIMVHVQQGRSAIATALQPLADELTKMPAPARRELQALADLVTAEQDLAVHLDAIQRELHGNKNPAALATLLDDVCDANRTGASAASRLESTVPEFPGPEKLRTEA